jgi:hypothetical protein
MLGLVVDMGCPEAAAESIPPADERGAAGGLGCGSEGWSATGLKEDPLSGF